MDIENRIIRYIEDRLSETQKLEFEAMLKEDPILNDQVSVMIDFRDNSKPTDPPYHVRKKVYEQLGITDHSYMEIILKKSSELFDIIAGKEYHINKTPALIYRSAKDSILFNSIMNNYDIYCEVFPHEEFFYIKLSVLHEEKKNMNNIKFSVFHNGTRYDDKFSDMTGTTGKFEIDPGDYEIKITHSSRRIGDLKINVS